MNNNFENSYRRLKKFVENCEKENDEYFIINNYNIEEFEELLNDILKYSDSEYANEILEYINELKLNINDKKMIDKFIPVFAALHCLSTIKNISHLNDDIKVDDWVFEICDLMEEQLPPLDARIGKVIDKKYEDGIFIYKVEIPFDNEIVTWENPNFIVIPNMEETLKLYRKKYIKTF